MSYRVNRETDKKLSNNAENNTAAASASSNNNYRQRDRKHNVQ